MSVCEDDKCDITGAPLDKKDKKKSILLKKNKKPITSCDFTGKEDNNCNNISKIEMIVQKGCGWCDYAKEHLQKAKVDNRITEIDINAPNVDEYIKKGWVDGTPTFIINETEVCELDNDDKKKRMFLRCKNNSKVYL